MDLGLSDEQLLLRDSARAFVERVCPPSVAKRWDGESHSPPELFDALADLDWLSLAFEPEDGDRRAERSR